MTYRKNARKNFIGLNVTISAATPCYELIHDNKFQVFGHTSFIIKYTASDAIISACYGDGVHQFLDVSATDGGLGRQGRVMGFDITRDQEFRISLWVLTFSETKNFGYRFCGGCFIKMAFRLNDPNPHNRNRIENKFFPLTANSLYQG